MQMLKMFLKANNPKNKVESIPYKKNLNLPCSLPYKEIAKN